MSFLEIYDLINTVLFVILAFMFMRAFLHPKQISSIKASLLLGIWCVLEIVTVNLFASSFILKALITITLTSVASLLLFRTRFAIALILSFLEYGLCASLELCLYFISVRHVAYISVYDLDESLLSIFVGTASELLLLLIIIGIRTLVNKQMSFYDNALELLKFSVFPLASLLLIVIAGLHSASKILTDAELFIYGCLALILLLSNIYIYWLLKIDIDNKILKEKTAFFELYSRDLKEIYEQIEEEHHRIEGIEHEYKNHIAVINNLTFSNKIDKLKSYLKEHEVTIYGGSVIDTGNDVISALFNFKYEEAKRKGITVRFDICNLKNVSVSDTDMVVIISNLFNNAIEACDNGNKDKIINIKISNNEGMVYILFSNPYSEISPDNHRSSNDLYNGRRRGYGLANVRRIVESYGGQMDIDSDNHCYTVRVLITE